MEKSPSNFKEIPLTSKVWGERDFDDVPLILLVCNEDGDTSGVWAGIYEGPEEPDENELGEDGEEGMSTQIFGFGNIDGVYTPKANVDLDAVMELWLQQIRETPAGQKLWHNGSYRGIR